MGIRDLLREIARTYDADAGTKREVVGQRVLRAVKERKDLALPAGLVAEGHGGQATAAATPWIGVFDPKINSAAQRGLYLAYIFSADLQTVSLTLQQGITELEDRLGRGTPRQEHLRRQAERLRRAVATQRRQGWVNEPKLRHGADRPKAYEAASVIARPYTLSELPDEEVIYDDLLHAAELLRRTHDAHRLWLYEDSGGPLAVNYEPDGHQVGETDALAGFHPKDSSDYIANIVARQQVKKRYHEALIASFGQHIVSRGYVPITRLMHPKDLVLRRDGEDGKNHKEWLVEAKIIRSENPTEAVRQAVGQLYEYSHFLYHEKKLAEPHLIGLFNEDVGTYSAYLARLGIAAIWQVGNDWEGSEAAVKWGMVG
jgi:hypothetical protein